MLELLKILKENGISMRVNPGITFLSSYNTVNIILDKDDFHVSRLYNLSDMEHCNLTLEELVVRQARELLRGPGQYDYIMED